MQIFHETLNIRPYKTISFQPKLFALLIQEKLATVPRDQECSVNALVHSIVHF